MPHLRGEGPLTPTRSWRTVRPFLVGLACFAVLAVFNEARGFALWRNYALSGVALGGITTWILWRHDVRIPAYIQWVIVAGLLLHYGGGSLGSPDPYHMGLLGMHGVNGAYHEYSWWDNLTHGVGIGAGAMAIAYLAEAYQMRRGLAWPAWSVAVVAILGALTAGVAVELYEYLGKTLFQTIDQGGYVNTVRDLHFNILGAIIGAVVAVLLDRRRFADRIARHWGRTEADRRSEPWTARIPAGMRGFLAFTLLPALASLALGAQFYVAAPPHESDASYEQTLQTLLWSMLAGIAAGLAAWYASRRTTRAGSSA